jgi:MoaA/NifB/PqqE/SkfB family radical SAM enzyme
MNMILPEELRIGITHRCNLRCGHCYVHDKDVNVKSIGVAAFAGLIDQLSSSLKRISITGGEAMMERDGVFSILERCDGYGINVRLVTNGMLLTSDDAARLVSLPVKEVQIGIDSLDSGYHDMMRVEGAHASSCAAIRTLIGAGVPVTVRFTVSRKNIDDAVPVYEFFSGIGAAKFKIRMLFPGGCASSIPGSFFLSGSEWARLQYECILASAGGVRMEITQPCRYTIPDHYGAYRENCVCGTKAAYVNWNGDVKYCLFDAAVIGNIRDMPFDEIWNGSGVRGERSLREPTHERQECSAFAILHGGYDTFLKEYISECMKLRKEII